MTRKAPIAINKLTAREQFQLLNHVQTNYAASKLSDREFAAQASEALGFPVTRHNVAGAREVFDIPSTLVAKREEAKQPRTRLERVEARLERLENLARELGWPVCKFD